MLPTLHRLAPGRTLGMLVTTSLLLGLAGTVPAAADATCSGPCCILDDCSGIDALPSAADCEADDCTCAQKVECYLRGQNPTQSWPLIPSGELRLNRLFFHDRFIETRISPGSLADWVRFSDPATGPVRFPNGTVVYKSGYLPSSDDPSRPETPALSAYVLVKIDGYCPEGSSVGNDCLGGGWFSMEVSNYTYGILEPGQIDNEGKATRCFACHAAAADSDWLWQLHSRRRYP